ncbi:MAG: DUF2318 domain-containing protein [Chloroflexi bacterium]|nr:DUF2318 domain-containing protein [Chloroflexota bacterium]
MMESMVITLREGIEAALVVGIILAYLGKSGNGHLNRRVYQGLAVAVIASIAFGVLLYALKIDAENEYLEGTMFAVAGALVASLVIWMWRAGKRVKADTEKRLASMIGQEHRGSQGWGLFAFTFFMVFREGAETVLFLMSATLGKFDLFSLSGGIAGIALAVLFAIFFIKGSLRINLSRFFTVTSVVLLLLALKLVLNSVHEFAEVEAIPLSGSAMSAIAFIAGGEISSVILMALLAAPLLVILWDARGTTRASVEGSDSPAARRKRIAALNQERLWRFGLVAAALLIVVAMGYTLLAQKGTLDPEPKPVASQNGQISIPLSTLEAGKLAKFYYDADGVPVRFLAVRASDGTAYAAFDACQICGAKGFVQDGEDVICKNCNAPIPTKSIGQRGGCNPLPMVHEVNEGILRIPASEMGTLVTVFR